MQPHQHDQPEHLRLVWQQPRKQAREPHRILREVAPRDDLRTAAQVTLVEHQVEHGEDRVHAGHERGALRHSVRDVRFHDLAFGAHDPLRHRRL